MGDNFHPQFTYKGKKYKVLVPSLEIPKIGLRTAKEIAVDEAAQAYLIDKGRGGDSIAEVSSEKAAVKKGDKEIQKPGETGGENTGE